MLTISGLLSLAGYALFFFLMHAHSLWSSPTLVQDRWKKIFYPIKNLFPETWVRANHYNPLAIYNSAAYLVLLGLLFAIYFMALRSVSKAGAFGEQGGGAALRRIMIILLPVLIVLFFLPGAFSSDLFSYVWYGRIFAVLGGNPFIDAPQRYVWVDTSHWLQWVYWKDTPSVYGPVWIWLAGAIASIAQAIDGDIVTNLLGHKALADLANLLNVLLLWKVSGMVIARYWRKPELPAGVSEASWRTGMQVAVTLSYAWNPLIVIEFGANGHNDVLLVTGLLAALWLHLSGRWQLAIVALALASLVKVIALIFLPGYLWLLLWSRYRAGKKSGLLSGAWVVVQGLIIMVAAWVLAYLPFWAGPATLKPLAGGPATEFFVNSLGALIRLKSPEAINQIAYNLGLQPYAFWSASAIGARLDWPARWGLLFITATVAVLQTWPARTFQRMLLAWGWVVFIYLSVGSVWFWPWYVTWLIVPVALVEAGRLFKATQILCVSSMAMYAIFPALPSPLSELPGWSGLLIAAPPLLYLAVSALGERKRDAEREPEPGVERQGASRAVRVPSQPAPSLGGGGARVRAEGQMESAYMLPPASETVQDLRIDEGI